MTLQKQKHWNRWLRTITLVLLCVTVMLVASDAFACPTCKDVLDHDDPLSQARAAGYFYSILFMMAMPFVLIGTFGGAAYLSIRRARGRRVDSETDI